VIVGAFGPVVFSVSADVVRTFRNASRERGTTFAVHEPIGHAPRLEPTSPELAKVRLEINLDHGLGTSPAIELVALGQLMDLQMPWPLILGPVPMGEYVLTKITEDWKRFTRIGVLAQAAVVLELLQDTDGVWERKARNALGL
jgi:hypothetical protein